MKESVRGQTDGPTPRAYPPHRHHVGGQCARLVRTDDGRTAQRLHRGQAADNGILAGHPAGAQGQTGGDDGSEPLGNGRHCQCYGNLEVVHCSLEGTMGGVSGCG